MSWWRRFSKTVLGCSLKLQIINFEQSNKFSIWISQLRKQRVRANWLFLNFTVHLPVQFQENATERRKHPKETNKWTLRVKKIKFNTEIIFRVIIFTSFPILVARSMQLPNSSNQLSHPLEFHVSSNKFFEMNNSLVGSMYYISVRSTYRFVSQVLHAAVQVRGFPEYGGHVLRVRYVEVRTGLCTAVIQAVLMNVAALPAASLQHAVAVRPCKSMQPTINSNILAERRATCSFSLYRLCPAKKHRKLCSWTFPYKWKDPSWRPSFHCLYR